jgi:hypothetical protein
MGAIAKRIAPTAEKSNRLFRVSRHIAATGQQARDRDILVDLFPMKANAADLDALALRRGRA